MHVHAHPAEADQNSHKTRTDPEPATRDQDPGEKSAGPDIHCMPRRKGVELRTPLKSEERISKTRIRPRATEYYLQRSGDDSGTQDFGNQVGLNDATTLEVRPPIAPKKRCQEQRVESIERKVGKGAYQRPPIAKVQKPLRRTEEIRIAPEEPSDDRYQDKASIDQEVILQMLTLQHLNPALLKDFPDDINCLVLRFVPSSRHHFGKQAKRQKLKTGDRKKDCEQNEGTVPQLDPEKEALETEP